MRKYAWVYTLLLMFVFCTSSKGQNQTDLPKENIKSETKDVVISLGPKTITRTIKQDRNGNIWIAAFDGIFRYDGKSFINITSKVTSARFFYVLEDRKGNFWFSSIGSGVYYYDGKSFQNFTTKEGLANDRVTNIYEDKKGNIWTSSESEKGKSWGWALSRYDEKSLSNKKPTVTEIKSQSIMIFGILEDYDGNIWFGDLKGVHRYDGKTITDFKDTEVNK